MLTAFNNLLKTESAPITIYATRTEVSGRSGLLADYPGAAAAYSLRLLDTDYTGSAIRVRRASDNAEQDIGFDSNGDLDTTALATFCSGTDGFVKVWYDQSGNGLDAEQTTTGAQPKVYDSVNGVIEDGSVGNEKPAVFFNGTTTSLLTSSVLISGAVGRSMFAVAKDTYTVNNATIISLTNSTTTSSGDFWIWTKEMAVRVNGNKVWASNPWNSQSINSIHLPSNGDVVDISLYENGTIATSTGESAATINTMSTGVSEIGAYRQTGGYWWSGPIQEIVLYDSDQSSNRTGIETNINDYYNIYTP